MSRFAVIENGREEHGAEAEHDPYARRLGYATSVDGRTDRTTTAMVAGVATAAIGLFVLGFLQVDEWLAFPACAAVGVAVWLLLRARRRRLDRGAGRSPDTVAHARDRAVAAANDGHQFFIATNPVVVIVMGAIFLLVAVASLVIGDLSVGRLVVAFLLGPSGVVLVLQGIGTRVVQQRRRTARSQ